MNSLSDKAKFTQEVFQTYTASKNVRYMGLANTMFSGAVQQFSQALTPRTSGTNILAQVKSPLFRPMQALHKYAANGESGFHHASSMPVMHGDQIMTNSRLNTAISASRRRQIMVVDDEN